MRVSVVVPTYDHQRYIDEAVSSVLRQRTSFDFEVILSEDCSTDGTRDKVLEWGRRSDRVRLLLSDVNLRSNEVVARGFRAALGEYIALLDGDDLWTSPDKLERQVEFLDRNPGCTMCFHNASVMDAEGVIQAGRTWTSIDVKRYSTLEDILAGNFIATCTTMFRNGVLENVPAWYADFFPMTDWPLYVLYAEHGQIGYIPEVMSAYRIHSGGQYSRLTERQRLDRTDRFYRDIDGRTDGRHRQLVRRCHWRYFLDWALEYLGRGEVDLAKHCYRVSFGMGGPSTVRGWTEAFRVGLRVHAPGRRLPRSEERGEQG